MRHESLLHAYPLDRVTSRPHLRGNPAAAQRPRSSVSRLTEIHGIIETLTALEDCPSTPISGSLDAAQTHYLGRARPVTRSGASTKGKPAADTGQLGLWLSLETLGLSLNSTLEVYRSGKVHRLSKPGLQVRSLATTPIEPTGTPLQDACVTPLRSGPNPDLDD